MLESAAGRAVIFELQKRRAVFEPDARLALFRLRQLCIRPGGFVQPPRTKQRACFSKPAADATPGGSGSFGYASTSDRGPLPASPKLASGWPRACATEISRFSYFTPPLRNWPALSAPPALPASTIGMF